MARYVWKPIDRWPREQTVDRAWSPFRHPDRKEVAWYTTEVELDRELEMLGVEEAIIQVAVKDRDIRVDGTLRADVRPSHPGVVFTFVDPRDNRVVTMACDKWTTFDANIRGITKALEALRLLDRYGITTTGEQYTGWKELPSGIPLSQRAGELEEMSIEQAARIVVGWISATHELATNARTAIEDADYRRYAYRQAIKHLHPDAGGTDSDGFLRLQRANDVLAANDGPQSD